MARNSTIVIALSHRVAAFTYGTIQDDDTGSSKGFRVEKIGEWATAENEAGELSSSHSTSGR